MVGWVPGYLQWFQILKNGDFVTRCYTILMNQKDLSSPLLFINFSCSNCRFQFEGKPGRVEDSPEKLHHPWSYWKECPKCLEEAQQAGWERNLMLSFGKHSGPKTAAGIAAVTRNLDGHPTPEEARLTRFNAVKNLRRAEIAQFLPAKHGRYEECETCPVATECIQSTVENSILTVDKRGLLPCMHPDHIETFMLTHIAVENEDPTVLSKVHANMQAKIHTIINRMILSITQKGVLIEQPAFVSDKDGMAHLAKYVNSDGNSQQIMDYSAHPLLKILGEFITRNNLSLGDMGMTQKTSQDDELLTGFLDEQNSNKEHADQLSERQTKALEGLEAMIQRSHEKSQSDPVLIEQQGDANG